MKLGISYVEKVIQSHCDVHSINKNQYFKMKYDYILAHDATFSLLIDEITKGGINIYNPDALILVADHFAAPATIDRANILNKFLNYAKENTVSNLSIFQGICHQILVEHQSILPGQVILGADSHTVTASALGCLAFGLGSYDILYALAFGYTMFMYKKITHVVLEGKIPETISGKDIFLHLIRRIGEDGGDYSIWEIHDQTDQGVCQDDRFAFSNMCVEAGAISAVFVPDRITMDYVSTLKNKSLEIPNHDGSSFCNAIRIDVSSLKPQVAKPHSPANVADISEVEGTSISQIFIGSCASGRLSDLKKAADSVKGKKIKDYLKAVVIPSSVKIYKEAMALGYIETLLDAGFVIGHPSCGPCGKIDKGVLGDHDICLSTSNRNYQGRMGSSDAQIYLASPQVCAVSALEGVICSP